MSVAAYITTGSEIIPVLLPTEEMRETARQIGVPEEDLFRIDVPAGMTRWTRASVLIASTQIAALTTPSTVGLTINDSSGAVTFGGLYVRPIQPFFWGSQGGVALVELVDQRWWWQFSSGTITAQELYAAWSSDGRWQDNDVGVPDYITLLSNITSAATAINLTMPTGFTVRSPEHLRRLSDLFATPNVSLAVLVDAIAAANWQVVVNTGAATAFIERDTLQAQYDTRMNAYKQAYLGGGQPVNGTAGGTDALVNLWNQGGFGARAPRKARVMYPSRSIEGLTQYNNITSVNVPSYQNEFILRNTHSVEPTMSWVRQPQDIGRAILPEAAVITLNNSFSPLNSTPGWNSATLTNAARDDYIRRYSRVPFGRTMWAGWIPWYTSSTVTIGQIGNVSYRLAVIDGHASPYTISTCDEDDWRLGPSGKAINDPAEIVTAKGKAQAYRNCIGATIIDAPPPNTRVFPAKITGYDTVSTWRFVYSWEEVEPDPTSTNLSVTITPYARTGTTNAKNMAENGNVYVGPANPGNAIAPGVLQSDYANAIISALPISNGTIVMMCEQANTAYTGGGMPAGPQYWFSMPNAVLVECTEEGGG